MSEKYYVSGCVDNGLSAEVVEDEHAEFWTLYARDSEGLSEGIIDCVFRKDAEAAMAVYVERDRLNEQVRALLDDRDEWESKAISNAEYCVNLDSRARKLAVEVSAVKSAVELHASGFAVCPVCSHELPSETDDVVWMVRDIETTATDAILNEVRAEGAEACVRQLVTSDDDDFTDAPNICAEVAARIRAGEVPNV